VPTFPTASFSVVGSCVATIVPSVSNSCVVIVVFDLVHLFSGCLGMDIYSLDLFLFLVEGPTSFTRSSEISIGTE
jgi:hypothetical protein